MGADIPQRTVSIWSMVLRNEHLFVNPVYFASETLLDLSTFKISQISMLPWNEYFKRTILFPSAIQDLALIDPFLEKEDGKQEEEVEGVSSGSGKDEMVNESDDKKGRSGSGSGSRKEEKREEKRKSKKGSKMMKE